MADRAAEAKPDLVGRSPNGLYTPPVPVAT